MHYLPFWAVFPRLFGFLYLMLGWILLSISRIECMHGVLGWLLFLTYGSHELRGVPRGDFERAGRFLGVFCLCDLQLRILRTLRI